MDLGLTGKPVVVTGANVGIGSAIAEWLAEDGVNPPPTVRARDGNLGLYNASICAARPLCYELIYNVAKIALIRFSKTLANEAIRNNIRVNCVSPGLALTPDWIKTAKQLTPGGDGARKSYRADQVLRQTAGTRPLLRIPVLWQATYSVGSIHFVYGGMLKTV